LRPAILIVPLKLLAVSPSRIDSNRTNYPNTQALFWPKITKTIKLTKNKYNRKTFKANPIIRTTNPEFINTVKEYLKEKLSYYLPYAFSPQRII